MILVCGATGTVGHAVVSQLQAQGADVRALTRHPDTAQFPAGVDVVGGDLDRPETLAPALDGVKQIFLASTGNVTRHDRTIAEAAAKIDVQHLVKLSVIGATEREAGRLTPARAHIEGEELIERLGLPWSFLRPGTFMTNALGWAESIRAGGEVHVPFAHSLAAPIDPADIAAVAVLCLTGKLETNAGYPLAGPELLSPADQVEIIAAAIGKPLKVAEVPAAAMRQNMIKSGMPAELVDGLFASLEGDRVEARLFPTVEEVTGRPPRSFADWLGDNLAAFTG